MPDHARFLRSFISSLDIPDPDEKNSDFEKYESLISSLRGFEEYTLDRGGFIISSNLDAVTITGYEEWEVIGKHISIFYATEDRLAGKPQADLERAGRHEPLVFTGLRIKKRNASFWAKIRLRTFTENDEVVGYKMTLQDATHNAVSAHQVKGFRDEYLSLFNNSFVGIFRFSMQDHAIIMMNEKAVQLAAIDMTQDKPGFHQLFENPDDFLHLITHLKADGKLEEWEFRLKNEDRWVTLSCRYFRDRQFVEGIMVDTTLRRRSTLELYRLRNELDQLIYHASHELRSPIVSMLGIINLINAEKDLQASLELSAVLREKVNQLDELLKNVTAIAWNSQNPLVYENFEWEDLVKSVLKELKPSANSRIQVFYSVVQHHVSRNDVARIRAILRNLVSNAFKYFNPEHHSPWINIKVSAGPATTLISVSDNGIGIDRAYLTDIFGMFYKATEYPKGPGLGLYIVKAMTEKLEGIVQAESALGKGTTFLLTIPNRPAPEHLHAL